MLLVAWLYIKELCNGVAVQHQHMIAKERLLVK